MAPERLGRPGGIGELRRPGELDWRLVFIALLALVFVLYLPSLSVPFQFDDSHSIEGNAAIQNLRLLPRLWTDPATSSIIPDNRVYRPLTFTLYAVCWALGQGSTIPFHLLKILMHAVTALSLFLIWRRLFRIPGWWPIEGVRLSLPASARAPWLRPHLLTPEIGALVLAFLFAINTSCSEIVTYVCASTSLQCAMFYVLAFWLFLLYWDGKRARHLWISLGLFAASCMSKEEGITLPAVVALTAFLLPEEGAGRFRLRAALRASLPYWGAAALLALVIVKMMPASFAKSRGLLPWQQYFYTQWRAYLWYMRIWFWPWGLNADNEEFGFSHSFTDPAVLQAFIGNSLLLAFAWWKRRKFPAFWYGLLWFYITISPASSIIPLAEPVNERRMYLSYIGFAGGSFALLLWALSTALAEGAGSKVADSRGADSKVGAAPAGGISPPALTALTALAACGLCVGTVNRELVWRTARSLWQDTVDKNPSSGRAMNNLALIYMHDPATFPQALDLLDRCERVWPYYMYCPLNKAAIYMALHDVSSSEKNLLRAKVLDPESTWVNFYLGRFYETMKSDLPKALLYYARADQLAGGAYIEAKTRMGEIYLRLGDREHATAMASQLIRLDPGNPTVQDFLRKARGT